MNKHVRTGIIALGLLSFLALPAESAGKKQTKGFCLPFSLQLVASVVAAVNKKTAPCLIPIMKKRK